MPRTRRLARVSHCLILSCCFAQGAAAQEAPDVTPADVYALVAQVRAELEQTRFVMGRPENLQAEINVQGAAPREVYYQALSMFRKAERLCFEQTREHVEEPGLPKGELRPADVFRVVLATLNCVQRVNQAIGVEQQAPRPAADPNKTPTSVFRATVQASRQLNLLLERRFAPSDVFQEVTLGVGYAASLLETLPDATTLPDAPPLQVGKRPQDVYRLLHTCFQRVRRVAQQSGLSVLELQLDDAQVAVARPSDVYDIASLVVSELAYLHSRLEHAEPPREVYYVGRKFPSHVYQRAGVLDRQLETLEEQVAAHPDWLSPREEQ